MKFGMNMLLWTDTVSEQHRPVLEQLKKMGYDGVEIPILDRNPEHCAKVGRWLKDLGLECTAVTCLGADDNPISPDPAVRAKGLATMKLVLDCCQAAGATILAGPFHSALGVFSGSGPTADEWRWAVDNMRPAAEYAQQRGVMLAIEYLNRFETYLLNSSVDTARFVKDVSHPHCRMMYDTFHANIEEKNIPTAIHACADVTVHVHISENDRSTPGQGNIPWKTTFDTLRETGYDGWLMIEAFGLALPAIAAATKIWRRMFTSEEQLAREGLAFMKQQAGAR